MGSQEDSLEEVSVVERAWDARVVADAGYYNPDYAVNEAECLILRLEIEAGRACCFGNLAVLAELSFAGRQIVKAKPESPEVRFVENS
jgi:hypothetical protein